MTTFVKECQGLAAGVVRRVCVLLPQLPTVADPYFGGSGPERTGCVRCGQCMVGCRFGAKNTLVKNYLWFAEKLGVDVEPDRTVVDVRPLGRVVVKGLAEGVDAYEVLGLRSACLEDATSHPVPGAGIRCPS